MKAWPFQKSSEMAFAFALYPTTGLSSMNQTGAPCQTLEVALGSALVMRAWSAVQMSRCAGGWARH